MWNLPNRFAQIDPNWEDDDGLRTGNTLDGVHYLHEEMRPFTKKSSSHKFGGASALDYELCIATHKPKITWLNGPYRAGMNDVTVYRDKGLKAAIEAKQQQRKDPNIRVIADDGYFAKDLIKTLAFRNEFDPRDIAYFKDRALARHERVNGRSKDFKCLRVKFRHDRGMKPIDTTPGDFSSHKACVEAIFVTIQVELDMGEFNLFDPYPN